MDGYLVAGRELVDQRRVEIELNIDLVNIDDIDLPPPQDLVAQIFALAPQKANDILVRLSPDNRDVLLQHQIVQVAAQKGISFATRTLALKQAIPIPSEMEGDVGPHEFLERLRLSWEPRELKGFFSVHQNELGKNANEVVRSHSVLCLFFLVYECIFNICDEFIRQRESIYYAGFFSCSCI